MPYKVHISLRYYQGIVDLTCLLSIHPLGVNLTRLSSIHVTTVTYMTTETNKFGLKVWITLLLQAHL
jgi:hypothetical protein